MTHRKQGKQQRWHPKYSIHSLFYMQVAMELSTANDSGGRQHDSPTPMETHTHTDTRVHVRTHTAKCNRGALSYFRFLWPQLWKCSFGTEKGKLSKNLGGRKENKWAQDRRDIKSNIESVLYSLAKRKQLET